MNSTISFSTAYRPKPPSGHTGLIQDCHVELAQDNALSTDRPLTQNSNRVVWIQNLILSFLLITLCGCASMINSAAQDMAENLSNAILNQNDLETVRAGAPAYLIMIDGLIEGDPNNSDLLIMGSKLYASYSSAFVEDKDRSQRLASKSLTYARQALCQDMPALCLKLEARLDEFLPLVRDIDQQQQALLYAYASAWANWIQANADDWNAVAQIPKLTALFEQSIALDENYDHGAAHLYLGVLAAQIPPSLGGKPQQARMHFEKAQSLSAGKNLMVHVLFAKHYARLVFDQTLHDQLLNSVLAADTNEPGLVLTNTLAKQQAAQLLKESNDFF